MSPDPMPSVLYVDDEQNNLSAFVASFRNHFRVFTALNIGDAQAILAKHEIHILLTDQRMPGGPGTTLLEYAITHYPNQVRILVSGYTDYPALLSAVQKGHIIDVAEKPWQTDDLKKRIDYAFSVYVGNLEAERKRLDAEKTGRLMDDDLNRLLEG